MSMMQAALGYAGLGWPVFPCDANDKQPKVWSRVEGQGGVKMATTDRTTLERWWREWPDAMIGVRTGSKKSGGAGFFVIDLDPGIDQTAGELLRKLEDWLASRLASQADGDFKEFADQVNAGVRYTLAEGPRVWTPRGGLHIWFSAEGYTDDVQIRNRANVLKLFAPGIDVRGDDGYVILPPSMRKGPKAKSDGCDGIGYTFDPTHHGEKDLPIAAGEVLDLVLNRHDGGERVARPAPAIPERQETGNPARDKAIERAANAALNSECRNVATAPKGNRNASLNNAAVALGKLIPGGFLSETVVRAQLEYAADQCGLIKDDGLASARKTIDSGLRFGMTQPRDMREVGNLAGKSSRPPPQYDQYAQMPFYASATPQPREEEERPADSVPRESATGGGSNGNGGGNDDDPPIYDDEGPIGEDPPPPSEEVAARLAGLDRFDLSFCADQPQNDTGNAWRLMTWYGDRFLNVDIYEASDNRNGLHVWLGTHWENEGASRQVGRWAQDTAENIGAEAELIEPTDDEAFKINYGHAAAREKEALLKVELPSVPDADKAGKEEIETAKAARAARKKEIDDAVAILQKRITDGEVAAQAVKNRKGNRKKFGISSGNQNRQRAMINLSMEHCSHSPHVMDTEVRAINVRNGTLRLKPHGEGWRLELDPHNRDDMITKVMPVIYDPDATCPKWDEFIERFQPNKDVREFLQLWHGLALTGLTEQAFVLNYGTGANGKSTFIETLARLMGQYAQTMPPETLVGDQQRRGDQATPDLAKLSGARLVRAAELPKGQNFRESTIKMLTGGDPIPVRQLHGKFWDLQPIFKAVGTCNEKPDISGVDEGIWRRVKLVLWEVTIPIDQRRRFEDVLAEFDQERSGILNWLLAGLMRYLREGFVVPELVRQATESYRADMDPIGSFIASCVTHWHKGEPDINEHAKGKRATALQLYQAYIAYCHANSLRVFSQKNFAIILGQKGVEKVRGHVVEYLDVVLHDVPEDPEKRSQGWRGPASNSVVYSDEKPFTAEQPFNEAPPPEQPEP